MSDGLADRANEILVAAELRQCGGLFAGNIRLDRLSKGQIRENIVNQSWQNKAESQLFACCMPR